VHNNAVGIKWTSEPESEGSNIILKDCICDSSGPTIKLFEVPNSIVFENNTGFGSREFNTWNTQPLLGYTGMGSLQSKLDDMNGLFSIKMDNVPYLGLPGWQSAFLNLSDGLTLLPYIRLNNGLDSFGYGEDLSIDPQPSVLKFFQGKQSYDPTDLHNSAIHGNYSFEVRMTNIGVDGGMNEYNQFRVDVKINWSNPVVPKTQIVGVFNTTKPGPNTNSGAPILAFDINNLLRFYANVTPIYTGRYRIYYEIRCLIPPVVMPFAAYP
jgi:hypothetical protein